MFGDWFYEAFSLIWRPSYILLVVDYVSIWVEVISNTKNDAMIVSKFFKKNIFSRFEMLAFISDKDSYFINCQVACEVQYQP